MTVSRGSDDRPVEEVVTVLRFFAAVEFVLAGVAGFVSAWNWAAWFAGFAFAAAALAGMRR